MMPRKTCSETAADMPLSPHSPSKPTGCTKAVLTFLFFLKLYAVLFTGLHLDRKDAAGAVYATPVIACAP